MNIEIIPYDEKYKADVQDVCLDTAGPNAREPLPRRFLLSTFCDYYIEQEGSHCFIAVDRDIDKAIGYILCAPDYNRYKRIFKAEYLPRTKGCAREDAREAWASMVAPVFFKHKYPAHMHTDIKPGYQHMGIGTRMMNALLEHLKQEGVKGMMLIVGAGNTNAQKFYMKNGLHKVFVIKNLGMVMARKIG